MNAKDKALRLTRVPQDTKEAVERNLKALQARRSPARPRAKLHTPLSLSSEPRTDVPPELLATRPWLRFYSPNVPFTIEPADDSLPTMLRESARQFPDKAAIIFYGHKLTYRELDAAADSLAAGLHAKGIGLGDRVALLLPNCPQFVIAYYGAMRAGAIVVPCNPLYVERELEHQLRDAGAKAIVTLSLFYKLVEAVRAKVEIPVVVVGSIKDYFPPALKVVFTALKEKKEGHRAELRGPGVVSWPNFLAAYVGQPAPPVEVKPDDIALYQYTGGTTGVPKAAMLSHRNLLTNSKMGWAWLGDAEKGQDVTLAAIPFFHVYGMTVAMNLSIYAGGTLIALPKFVPLDVMKSIERYRPTLFPGVPAMYIALINHPKVKEFDLSSVEACISGAAPLPLEVAHRFEELTGARLIEGFGMTELSPISHGNPLFGKRKEGSIGLPFPGVGSKIVDLEEGERDLPPGEIGELVVSGPMVMQGYYNRPGETAQTVRNGWLYTGDIAKMDEEGYFYIVDRKKDMILSNGFNVYPRDVEEVLYQHPAVREAVVIGAPNERGDETVKAFVVLKEGETATADAIIEFCRERLTRYKAPRSVEFRSELPKTMIGKHLRRKLVEEERQRLTSAQQGDSAVKTSAVPVGTTSSPKADPRQLPALALQTLQKAGVKIRSVVGKLRETGGNLHLPSKLSGLHLPKVKLPFIN